MRKSLSMVLAAALTSAVSGPPALAQTSPSPTPSPVHQPSEKALTKVGQVLTVPLTPNGKAAETGAPTGTATLTQRGKDVLVAIDDPALAHARRDARIARGSCAQPPRASAYRLAPVIDGKSQTTLKGANVEKLVSGGYALVISGATPVCGELAHANRLPGTQ
jgi:hypothetical protein